MSDQKGRFRPPFFWTDATRVPYPSVARCARELAQRFLVALVRDLGEVARQFEAHALARADGARILPFQPIEEIPDRHAQNLRDLIEPTGRNTVDAAFVFVRLLIGHPDQVGQLLLGQAKHDPPLAHPPADMAVDVLRAPGGTPRDHGPETLLLQIAAVLQARRRGSVLFVHFSHSSRFGIPGARLGARCGARFCVLAAIFNTKPRSVRCIRYSSEQPLNYR